MSEAEKLAEKYAENRIFFDPTTMLKVAVDYNRQTASEHFLAGWKARGARDAEIAALEYNSFDSSKSADYRDGAWLAARDIARAIRALDARDGEIKG